MVHTLDTHAFAYADRWVSKGTFTQGVEYDMRKAFRSQPA